ncbi:MAG: hypothetical protein ACUVQ8_00170 [Nitrososphaeria archaeon]
MPEIWLRYGKVEIALEIQRERLSQVVEDPLPDIVKEQLDNEVQPLKGLNEISLLAGDAEISTIRFIQYLISYLTPTKISIYSNERVIRHLRRELKEVPCALLKIDSERFPVSVVDGVSLKLPTVFSRKDLYFVSSVGFSPLFGFSGGSATLTEFLEADLKFEAIKRESDLKPNPGKETSAGWFADRVAEEIKELNGIEILPGRNGFSNAFIGNVREAHKRACQELLKCSLKKVSTRIPLAIVTPGEEEKCRTLDLSLNALWNILSALEEGASVILLAEATEGLGSEALSKYVYTGLDVKDAFRKGTYVEGLERLYYLLDASSRFDLGFLTTLPKAFIEKRLGFKSYPTGNSAVSYLVEKSGDKKKKITVLTRGDKSLILAD